MSTSTLLQPTPAIIPPPCLLDQRRDTARHQGYPEPAASAMADRCERFIRCHGQRHPREMGVGGVGQFLDHLAQTESDPVRTSDLHRHGRAFTGRSPTALIREPGETVRSVAGL